MPAAAASAGTTAAAAGMAEAAADAAAKAAAEAGWEAREDGTVDYAAALNELNKQGVTPENNAAVVLAEFYGPSVAGPEYCAEIGIDPLPVNGDYYESFDGYSGRDPEFRIHFPGMPVEEPGEDREIIAQFDLAKWLPWTVER